VGIWAASAKAGINGSGIASSAAGSMAQLNVVMAVTRRQPMKAANEMSTGAHQWRKYGGNNENKYLEMANQLAK
jgi:hypothetical protein